MIGIPHVLFITLKYDNPQAPKKEIYKNYVLWIKDTLQDHTEQDNAGADADDFDY